MLREGAFRVLVKGLLVIPGEVSRGAVSLQGCLALSWGEVLGVLGQDPQRAS